MSVNSINPTAKSYFDTKQTKIQETRKVSNKQPNLTPKGTRKRKTDKIQS